MSNINNIEDYNVNNNDDKTNNHKTLGLPQDPESPIARRHLHAHLVTISSPSSLSSPPPFSQARPSVSSQPDLRDTTVIHTHSSNFRDIVQQLTGPSRDNHDLLAPVTLPPRLATNKKTTSHNNNNNNNSYNNTTTNDKVTHNTKLAPQYTNGDLQDVLTTAASVVPSNRGVNAAVMTRLGSVGNSDQLGLRKAPLKLHERRKFMSNMKNLTTTTTSVLQQLYGEQHHLVEASASRDTTTTNKYNLTKPTLSSPHHYYNNPSPITPLASDFERFCTAATTPTSSSSSRANSALNPPSINSIPNTYNETHSHSDYRCSFSTTLDPTSPISLMSSNNYTHNVRFPLPKSSVDHGHDNDLHMDVTLRSGPQSPHESSGLFLQRHSPPPPTITETGIGATTHTTDQKASPTLLNLFPESPECSPRHG